MYVHRNLIIYVIYCIGFQEYFLFIWVIFIVSNLNIYVLIYIYFNCIFVLNNVMSHSVLKDLIVLQNLRKFPAPFHTLKYCSPEATTFALLQNNKLKFLMQILLTLMESEHLAFFYPTSFLPHPLSFSLAHTSLPPFSQDRFITIFD